VGDVLQYTMRVAVVGGTNIRLLVAPDFGSFQEVSSTRGTEFRSVNGQAKLHFSYTFALRATKAGKFQIRGPMVDVGGQRISPKPVTVAVVKRGVRPPKTGRGDVWVHGSLSKRDPFVGEQVLLEYSLMLDEVRVGAFGVDVNDIKNPSFDGFWVEGLSNKVDVRVGRRQFDGVQYASRPLQLDALFPLRAGPLEVEALTMDVSVSSRSGLGRRRRKIESEPLKLEVRPLPSGAPAGFDESNVGQYRLEVKVDKRKVRSGEPLTIRVTVRGRGMVSRVDVPTLPEQPKRYRILPPVYDKKTEVLRDRRVGGFKTAEIVLTPLVEGPLTIPGLRFVYFDPATERYVTLVSKVKVVEVSGEVRGGALEEEELVSRKARDEPKVVSKAKQPLREVRRVSDAGEVPRQSPGVGFWVSMAAPPAAWFGFLLFGWVTSRREKAAPMRRSRSSASVAREAARSAGHGELGAVLNRYLSVRLSMAPGSVSGDALRAVLEGRGVATAVIGQLAGVQDRCDVARFSGSLEGGEELSAEVIAVVDSLEAAL
jgi:hypothetical protein